MCISCNICETWLISYLFVIYLSNMITGMVCACDVQVLGDHKDIARRLEERQAETVGRRPMVVGKRGEDHRRNEPEIAEEVRRARNAWNSVSTSPECRGKFAGRIEEAIRGPVLKEIPQGGALKFNSRS